MYFAILACMSSKVLSSQQLCHATDSEFFGFWPKKSKKLFGFVDRFIASLSESSAKKVSPDVAAEVVISNVKFACSPDAKLLVCGGAAKETLEAVAAAVKEALPDAQILCGGTLAGDPATVRGLRDCDAIILVEQLDKSDLNATVQLKERADALEKDVLGVVIG